MSRFPLAALLGVLLIACHVTAPPRDAAQWESTVHGVQITWRLVAPGELAPYSGHAQGGLGATGCVVDIDAAGARHALARLAAHEAGHCLQGRYLIPPQGRPDLGAYFADPMEGWPEAYAQAYLAACGDSLRPLGWADLAVPRCAEAPHPLTVP